MVPRLSDLEPDGRRSWPLGASRPPWFALGVAVQSGPGLVGKGERGAGLMSAGDVDELSIILRPRDAGALTQRAERTRFYPDDKARSIRQREISWSDKMPMGGGNDVSGSMRSRRKRA